MAQVFVGAGSNVPAVWNFLLRLAFNEAVSITRRRVHDTAAEVGPPRITTAEQRRVTAMHQRRYDALREEAAEFLAGVHPDLREEAFTRWVRARTLRRRANLEVAVPPMWMRDP